MSKKITLTILGLLIIGFSLYGCGRVVNVVTPVHPSSQTYGVIIGTVKDTSGTALSAVAVTSSGSSSATNAQGWFTVSNLTATTREVVAFTKSGYVSNQKVVAVSAGQSTFVDVKMGVAGTAQTMDAITGGTITVQTSSGLSAEVTIPANSLVDSSGTAFTGTAQVQLTPFDPTVNNDLDAFPGNFEGINTSGVTQQFKSFGFMDINITGSGSLSLSAGKTATVTIPVPDSMTVEAAALGTCPMWYYDTSDGTWRQDGSGTYDAAKQAFVGTVDHFSTWNFDVSFTRAYISGNVVDGNGNPVQGAEVRCRGEGWKWSRWESGETKTGTDGAFTRIPVENNVTFECWAEKGGKKSAVSVFGPFAAASDNAVGNIVLDAPQIQFTLAWGQNPTDLDTHLTIPSTATTTLAAERGHLWYPYAVDKGYSNLSSTYPYAILDTDDVSSYGPEVTSIYQLFGGTYRYSVHHFSGSTTISDSSASVDLIVSGGGSAGIYNFTPPIGATGANDVWIVCDIVVDSSGNISEVNTIGDFLHDIAAFSGEAFSPNSAPTYRGPAAGYSVNSLRIK
ncbi:MAG: carboxypeptidase-like regulatory domain-containing protein [Candidatus Margulisiibacteriota bacterium]|nr:carboxypeptidase-like regulatory domain-containing protein [Candidatus Margulisiibacteriota bacterium]